MDSLEFQLLAFSSSQCMCDIVVVPARQEAMKIAVASLEKAFTHIFYPDTLQTSSLSFLSSGLSISG